MFSLICSLFFPLYFDAYPVARHTVTFRGSVGAEAVSYGGRAVHVLSAVVCDSSQDAGRLIIRWVEPVITATLVRVVTVTEWGKNSRINDITNTQLVMKSFRESTASEFR